MIPIVAKNKIRDLTEADVTTGLMGTGTTPPSVTDTNLETPDLTTHNSILNTTANQTINSLHILYSNQGNGITYSEIGLKFTDGTLFNRLIFPNLNKNSGVEVHTTIISRIN